MLVRKVLLVLACCLSVVITAGCATPAGPAEQPLHAHLEDTKYVKYVDDGLENALAELILSLDQVPNITYKRKAGSSAYRLVRRYVGGRSVENKPLEYLVLGQGRDVIFILATIHGNEPAGTPLVQRLAQYLRQHPLMLRGRTVVLVPAANPDGRANNRRSNANGVDLNRNFQTANRRDSREFGYKALSEPESRFIHVLIHQYKPDRIVSVHQPLTCIDYDGPAKTLADCMAKYCDLPIRKLGAKPGSLGSYAGETLGIPIVTFELPRDAGRAAPESVWAKYGNALVAAVLYPDLAK